MLLNGAFCSFTCGGGGGGSGGSGGGGAAAGGGAGGGGTSFFIYLNFHNRIGLIPSKQYQVSH